MTSYIILKHLHMTTAYLTITLFALRLLLDAVGRPGWRQTPLRFIPHINDTILLVAAIALVFPDSDNDGLSDEEEKLLGLMPDDADSDDDGVIDGMEPNFAFDDDNDGVITALDADADDDGVLDGTESGVTSPDLDTDLAANNFVEIDIVFLP